MTPENEIEPNDWQELKAEQLSGYFGKRKPDCEVTHRRDIDLGWRFYFVRDNRNAYILDIDRCVFVDWNIEQITSMLGQSPWEQVLEANPRKVPCFGTTGIEFRRWPV